MSKSWNSDSVNIDEHDPGDHPLLNSQVMWRSADNKNVYAWGGKQSHLVSSSSTDNPPDQSTWQFSPGDDGSITWKEVDFG